MNLQSVLTDLQYAIAQIDLAKSKRAMGRDNLDELTRAMDALERTQEALMADTVELPMPLPRYVMECQCEGRQWTVTRLSDNAVATVTGDAAIKFQDELESTNAQRTYDDVCDSLTFHHPSNIETLDYLKKAIEYAPSDPGKLAENLRGWWTADNLYICAHCAGRIIDRACRLPNGVEPSWADRPSKHGKCCLCSKPEGS